MYNKRKINKIKTKDKRQKERKRKNEGNIDLRFTVLNLLGSNTFICNVSWLPNRPLSRGGHFVLGDLKSFVYARLAS